MKLPIRASVFAILLSTLLLAPSPAVVGSQASFEWNQWRGPGRDGVGDPSTLPEALPDALTEVWRVPVGEGHSSPVVVDDVVYQFGRQDGREVLRALSLSDGTEIWSTGYEVSFTPEPAAREHGPGPKSTPVVAGGRIFTLGITGVLSAHDVADGTLLWRHGFDAEFPQSWPLWGASMSPMVVSDRLIAHVGGDEAGALTAFDVATGEILWSNDEFTPGYASPIEVRVEGTEVLVTLSNEHVIAVGLADGATLWNMRYATSSWQNAVSPLAVGDEVVISGLDMDIFALDFTADNGGLAADETWRSDAQPLYMSSPVQVGGRVVGMTHRRRGQFVALDADTGEAVWASRGREGENAALVVLGNRVAALTDAARLVIFDATADTYEPLAEYEVAPSPTWAYPAFTPQGVLVKDHDTLALLRF